MVRQGHLGTALPILEEVLELTRDSGDRQLEASALTAKALALKGTDRTEEALELTTRSLEIDRATGDRSGEISDLNNICTLLRKLGRIEESRSYGIQSLEACREAGDRRLEGNVLCSLAILERLEGRVDRALEYYHRSLEKHRAVGNSSGEAIVLGNIANALMDLNRVEEAMDSYRQSADVHRRVGSVRILSEVTGYLAVNLMDLDRPGEAEAFAAESRRAARDTDDWLGMMLSDLAYGMIAEKKGDMEEALDLYRSVYHRATENSEHPESIRALIGLGRIRLAQGRLEESRRHLLGALSMSGQTRVQSVHLEYLIHSSLAELSLAAGERRKALGSCRKALEYAVAAGREDFERHARELSEVCRALPE
jgi:tetratricopeptide (TPR) repeat protein